MINRNIILINTSARDAGGPSLIPGQDRHNVFGVNASSLTL